jgi:type VII secretion protein EccB
VDWGAPAPRPIPSVSRVAWQPTDRLQISGDRFLRRRLECALVGIDLRAGIESVRAPAHAMTAGLVAAVVALAGCLVLALLRPQPESGSAPILLDRSSGALYVRLGDTLHPALNLASARLIARTNAEPQAITASALGRSRLGPLLGIPGAPHHLGRPFGEGESQWTVCDGRDRTTVVIGGGPQSGVLGHDQTLLVTPASGGSTYLVFDGRRAVVNPEDVIVARAAGLDGQTPLPVSSVLLSALPESPPIAAPRIPGFGRRGPDALRGFPVGSVLRVVRGGGDEYYVVLADGVQRVGQLAADLVRFADSGGARTAISVAPDVIGVAKSETRLPVSDFPDRPRAVPVSAEAAVCVRWAPTASGDAMVSISVGDLPIPAGQAAVALAQADGNGPAVDAVYVPPGRAAYVRSTSLSGVDARAGTRYLISDTGIRYCVHDDDAAHDLGLPDAIVAAPWPVLGRLPAGPDLSRANASVAQDVPTGRSP